MISFVEPAIKDRLILPRDATRSQLHHRPFKFATEVDAHNGRRNGCNPMPSWRRLHTPNLSGALPDRRCLILNPPAPLERKRNVAFHLLQMCIAEVQPDPNTDYSLTNTAYCPEIPTMSG